MSISFAPSPTATVCSSGDADDLGEVAQRAGLALAVDDLPEYLTREDTINDFESVGLEVLHLEFGQQWLQHFHEAARDNGRNVAQSVQACAPGSWRPA